jgi:hypothetical protein
MTSFVLFHLLCPSVVLVLWFQPRRLHFDFE